MPSLQFALALIVNVYDLPPAPALNVAMFGSGSPFCGFARMIVSYSSAVMRPDGVSATSIDIDRLRVEQDQLGARSLDLQYDLSRLGDEPAIRKLSIDAGLTQLGEPLVVPAR